MIAELEKLVALQHSDTKIRQLKTQIQNAPQKRVTLEQEFEARASSIRELQKSRDDARAAKIKLENELANANAQLERAERNLKASQNQKQYEAAVREKGALQKQISDFETKILESDEAVETAEQALSERAEEIANLESERTENLQNFEADIERSKAEIESEQKRREEIFAVLPKTAANAYNRLATRIRDGVAVAEVRNGACSSCFMSLRPQMLVDIKIGNKIMTCESCHRILYHAPKETSQTGV